MEQDAKEIQEKVGRVGNKDPEKEGVFQNCTEK